MQLANNRNDEASRRDFVEIDGKTARNLFEQVQNDQHWKLPTKPIKLLTLEYAQTMASAIAYFHGGASIGKTFGGQYWVTSRGYNYYMGE